MKKRVLLISVPVLVVAAVIVSAVLANGRLRAVSTFSGAAKGTRFGYGQRGLCSAEPNSQVRKYPAFRSAEPVYGSVRFGCGWYEKDAGIEHLYAVDESNGTGTGYDLLYFDADRDLDLTNDSPVRPRAEPPQEGALAPFVPAQAEVCFETVHALFDSGPEQGVACRLMPRLLVYDEGAVVMFVAETFRKGYIWLEGTLYEALAGFDACVGTRYDWPFTALHLRPWGDAERERGRPGTDRLAAMHRINPAEALL